MLRKGVKQDIMGAHGKETQDHLLETTNVSVPGDSGAPVLDSDKRVVGVLYAGSQETSLVVPIEDVMSSLPEAF